MDTKTRSIAEAGLGPDQYEDLLDDLYEIYKNLDALDPVSMTPKQNADWTAQYAAVTDAIRALRKLSLDDINARLSKDADDTAQAIDEAEKALHGVRDKAEILNVVGNALKFISAIAALA